jgi:MoaA/NifB/PqqE/SkfB family radical SAM enzyme
MEINKSMCPLAWIGVAVDPDGTVRPCCLFGTENLPEDFNIHHPDILNHKFMKNVREQMVAGKPVSNCSKCYHDEKVKNFSLRLVILNEVNQLYQSLYSTNFQIPKEPVTTYLDLDMSNTCNLKCRMCSPRFSTSWYSDAKKLGLPIPKGVVSHNTLLENIDLKSLKVIKLSGGEALLDQDAIINILNKTDIDIEQLSLHIVTNVTTLPTKEFLDVLKKCKKVTLWCSVDAYGPLNDFLRKDSNWQQIVSNLDWYYNNFEIIVNSVVSIYNVNCFNQLIDFIKSRYPKTVFHNLQMAETNYGGVYNWMDPCNLPVPVKQALLPILTEMRSRYTSPIFSAVEKSLNSEGDFNGFVKFDTQLNQLRNEHWKDLNPELYNMITPYIV